jgi:hypothetical protein
MNAAAMMESAKLAAEFMAARIGLLVAGILQPDVGRLCTRRLRKHVED